MRIQTRLSFCALALLSFPTLAAGGGELEQCLAKMTRIQSEYWQHLWYSASGSPPFEQFISPFTNRPMMAAYHALLR